MFVETPCQRDHYYSAFRILLSQLFQKRQSFEAFALVKERYCPLPLGLIRSIRGRLCGQRRGNKKKQHRYENKASLSVGRHGLFVFEMTTCSQAPAGPLTAEGA